MSQTRVELDRKLGLLEAKAREFAPRRVAQQYKERYLQRYMPDYPVDRAIGAFLTLVGLRMAVRQVRGFRTHRERVRAAAAAYARW